MGRHRLQWDWAQDQTVVYVTVIGLVVSNQKGVIGEIGRMVAVGDAWDA
jgi:hypothetical protein